MSNQSAFSTITVIIIIAGLVVGAGGGYFLANNSLQSVISDYKTQVEDLNSDIDTLSSTILTIQSEKDVIENQVVDLEDQVTELSMQISSLESDNTELWSQVTDLTAQNTEKDSTITSLALDLAESEELVSEKEAEIDELYDDLEYYQSRLGERLGWTVYNSYKLHFEYPSDFEFEDLFATEESGMGVGASEDQNTMVMVIWGETIFNETVYNDTVLDESLDISKQAFLDAGGVTLIDSVRVNSTLLGHTMKYEYILATDGVDVSNVIYATWYCSDSNRIFVVAVGATNEDALVLFHRFIDTFVCHTGTLGY